MDVDELKTVLADLSKLCNEVDNDIIKKMYNELVAKSNDNLLKTNSINVKVPSTIGLVSKTQFNCVKQNLEKKIEDVDKKIPNTSAIVKKTDLNIKNYSN